MTQLNLLPDVKIHYLKATRNKRTVMGISLLVIAVSVAAILLLVSVAYVFQKKNLSDLNNDIKTYNQQLKDKPDLDKVLTIQNQLSALTSLHEQKPVITRLFGYMQQITPAATSITQLNVDFTANTIQITGSSPSLDVANTYIDTLKFTTYQTTTDGQTFSTSAKAFKNVVMSTFTRNNQGASYTILMSYNPEIFNSTAEVKFEVPKIVTTRSLTEQPTDLFKSEPVPTTNTTKGNQ